MAERVWTPQQKNAIDARGGTLLLSAAAGSDKTAVLVERIISLLIVQIVVEIKIAKKINLDLNCRYFQF